MNQIHRRRHGLRWSLALAVVLSFCPLVQAQQIKKDTLSGMKWRLIGPNRGGRTEAATGVPGTNTYYLGAVAGGVWKSADAGTTWNPIFDKEPIASIGAIAVAPSDPNVVYVGTGEPDIRGDISYGDGMWKSTDAGKTWTHIGLDDTRHIAKILVDPRDPNVVLVAAIGHAYGPNAERGVFRTTDGGKTWQKVLYKDDKTGAVDLTFDPNNSSIVWAAMYQQVRLPWDYISGGPGSGIYKSTDGGATWKQVKGNGLPEGILGRIGLAVGADSEHVYALIEAEKGGLYASDDAGEHWQFVTGDHRFRQRAWYFTNVIADPKNPFTIYILNTGVSRSTDGGHTWSSVFAPHGDNHCLWIDPTNPNHMIIANDGGASVSLNWGRTWSTMDNQPTAEFYHVAADNRFPYYLYGAQQDNSTVAIPSRGDSNNYYDVGGGESGWIVPDPSGDTVYADSYSGEITRFDRKTGHSTEVSPWPLNPMGHGAANLKYRFQWTAPVAASPFDPKTIYFGGNVLFKTTDAGQNWTIISPDLTRNDKSKQQSAGGPITKDNTSVEYYDTIFCIAPSSLDRGEIWIGSDDGLIHLTRDGGQHWENVTPKDMPEWSKISIIDASPFGAGTAYAAVDRSKNDDNDPYIYMTTDFGKTWTRINNGIPNGAFVHAVREDAVRKGLLFAGTELGVYVSFDDGANWQALKMNLPTVPVHDLIIKGNDLLIATHGRAFWALDDITPLRQLTSQVQGESAYLFKPEPAYRARFGGGFFGGGSANATIDYWLQSAPKGDVTLEILDAKGKLVRKYSSKGTGLPPGIPPEFARFFHFPHLTKDAGVNRFSWDLRYTSARSVPGTISWGGSPFGPFVVPGAYQAKLTVDGKSYTQPITVKEDPRVSVTQADLEKQLALGLEIQASVNSANDAVNEIIGLHAQLEALQKRVGASNKDIADAAKALDEKAVAIENNLIQPKSKSGEDPLNYPIKLADQMMALSSTVETNDAGPTAADYTVYNLLKGQIDEQVAVWGELQKKDLAALNEMMKKAKIEFISVAPPKGAEAM
jgi:photosystem II stability/assembly factor-like uncharacterized protein